MSSQIFFIIANDNVTEPLKSLRKELLFKTVLMWGRWGDALLSLSTGLLLQLRVNWGQESWALGTWEAERRAKCPEKRKRK